MRAMEDCVRVEDNKTRMDRKGGGCEVDLEDTSQEEGRRGQEREAMRKEGV